MINQIANKIKTTLNGFNEVQIREKMLKHYKTLHLINDEGTWATPELQNISGDLLPQITEEVSKSFIDKMALLAKENPYLVDFFEKIKNENFDILIRKVQAEGSELLPDVMAYSMVLERLTIAMYNDPKIIKSCIDIFPETRKKKNHFKGLNIFHEVKLKSVEMSIKNEFLKCHTSGIVKPDNTRWLLFIGILEAALTDFFNGYINNSKVGYILAVNKAGSKKYDPRTKAGPSKWSEDKKAIALSVPLPKEWADLYQTWNMAFVAYHPLFPYLLPKLFIPQVANYKDKPTEFMYNRVLALYVTVNYMGFRNQEKANNNEMDINWLDKKIPTLWGKINLENARNYQNKLKAAKN
jgi:hypothetical protein